MTTSADSHSFRASSLWFFAPAALLSLALMPDGWDLISVMMLSLLRSLSLFVGLVCLVATGRLAHWSSSKFLLVILITLGMAVLAFNTMAWQFYKSDFLPPPYDWIYLILVRALPICVMATAFVPSKWPYLACIGFTFVVGIVFFGLAASAEKTYSARHEAAARAENEAKMAAWNAKVAARMAELDRVPADAGPETLLVFIGGDEPEDVRKRATERLVAIPNVVERLAALLDGDRRLDGLYGLSEELRDTFVVPSAIKRRSWIAAGLVAKDMNDRMSQQGARFDAAEAAEAAKFCVALNWLTSRGQDEALAIRQDHRAALVALRDWHRTMLYKVSGWCGEPDAMEKILAAP